MKITHLYHSGILFETDKVVLLFDYCRGDLSNIPSDKQLMVFVSHRHGDHFSEKIFDLSIKHPNTIYIISDDIWESRVSQELYGHTMFMGPDENMDIKLPDDLNVVVRTYKSTDEGVAFVVDVGDKRIYHAGDLNYWYWEEEGKAWNNNQKANYERELKKIAALIEQDGKQVDYACIPIDARLKSGYYLGVDIFMSIVGASVIIPMHMFNEYDIIKQIKKREGSASYADKILNVQHKQQDFEA